MFICCFFSHVRLFATLWTIAHEAPPSMGFSRQEYWSGLLSPSPRKVATNCNQKKSNIYFILNNTTYVYFLVGPTKMGIFIQHLRKTGFDTLTPQQPQLYILKYWRQSLGFCFTSLPTASKQWLTAASRNLRRKEKQSGLKTRKVNLGNGAADSPKQDYN